MTGLATESSGRVVGIVADVGGRRRQLRARSVILATGYFQGDPDLRARFISPDAGAVDSIEPNQTGDGHRMTMALGVPMVNMGVGSAPEFRFVTRSDRILARRLPVNRLATRAMRAGMRFVPRPLFLWLVKDLLTGYTAPTTKLFASGAILVNRAGERFANELGEFTYAVAAQPDKVAYLLFDETVAREFSSYPNVISTAPGIAYAFLPDYRRLRPDIYHVADTLPELARRAALPPDALEMTVRAYNATITDGTPDPFGREGRGPAIRRAPFHLLGPARSYFVDSQGGPAVDERCRVIGADGRPVAGLYAVGALAKASLLYGGAGFDLAWVFTSARLGGTAAAMEDAA